MNKLLISATLAAVLGTGVAAAESGVVIGTQGASGSAHVVRAGVVDTLSSGDVLQAGDRIVTRAGGSVDLQFDGCEASLAESSTIVLGSNFCAQVIEASAQQTSETSVVSGSTAATANFQGASPVVLGLGAIVVGGAIAGIIVAATDDDQDEPVSP